LPYKCFEHRDPLHDLKSSHPHWLDRIACVQGREQTSEQTSEPSALGSLHLLERKAWLQMQWSRTPDQKTQMELRSFQTSPRWQGALPHLQIDNLLALKELELARLSRNLHPYSCFLMVKEDAAMEYDAASKMAAIGIALRGELSWYKFKAQKALRHSAWGAGSMEVAGHGGFAA